MSDRMLVGQLATSHVGPLHGNRTIAKTTEGSAATATSDVSFKQLLARADLRFSHHAEQRLKLRGIELDPDQLDRISNALDQAAAKGAKDSLVLFRNIAMIVNVPNRTVVTAMDGASMNNQVFTQIDSAVVVS